MLPMRSCDISRLFYFVFRPRQAVDDIVQPRRTDHRQIQRRVIRSNDVVGPITLSNFKYMFGSDFIDSIGPLRRFSFGIAIYFPKTPPPLDNSCRILGAVLAVDNLRAAGIPVKCLGIKWRDKYGITRRIFGDPCTCLAPILEDGLLQHLR